MVGVPPAAAGGGRGYEQGRAEDKDKGDTHDGLLRREWFDDDELPDAE